MTDLELTMVAILSELKENHGVVEVKAEFETEGTRMSELMRLKDVADRAGLGLLLKIGGAEAMRDMFDAQLIGVSGIVAPMIESGYAMKKYLEAVDSAFPEELRKRMQLSINIETKLASEKLDEILAAPGIERLNAVCVGRVDLSGSMGLDRSHINGPEVFQITKEIFQRTRSRGLKNKIGGGISREAVSFIKELVGENLLDFYETRKVVFRAEARDDMEEGILKAGKFELAWLLNKKQYYERIAQEDQTRIAMMQQRLGTS